jgi:hypothetical protein
MSAASYTSPRVLNLDGTLRGWNETFTSRPGDSLRTDRLDRYIVRGTYSDDRPHIDLSEFPAENYQQAVLFARRVRNRTVHAEDDFTWAVVDFVYAMPDGRKVRSNG